MSKKIMILGASILQLPAINKAKEMGLEVVVVDMNPDAVGFAVPGVKREIISTIDIPAVLEAAKRHKIDGIMTLATDMPMRTVATVAKELGLVGITEETAINATDKASMRKSLQVHNVPIPKYFKVMCRNEIAEIIKQFEGPVVVKPADSSGSRGICLVEDASIQEDVLSAYDYSRRFSRSGVVVIEEYMRGPEVSVETIALNGECNIIQITDKLTTGAPHFVEMGHSQPTKLEPNIVEQVKSVAKQANEAIGIMNGPSHTEIIITKDGPKIVELGARLGGDNITTHLVPLSTGGDMVECCIDIALGNIPNIRMKENKASAIRYFRQHEGVVKKIEGVEFAEKIEGVKQISIVHGVGERISEIESSGSRMGFVIAQGSCVENAIKSCEQALKKIKIEIGEHHECSNNHIQ